MRFGGCRGVCGWGGGGQHTSVARIAQHATRDGRGPGLHVKEVPDALVLPPILSYQVVASIKIVRPVHLEYLALSAEITGDAGEQAAVAPSRRRCRKCEPQPALLPPLTVPSIRRRWRGMPR